MKPVVFETTCDLAGLPDRVWELLTAWERQSEWMLEMSDVIVTSLVRDGVGVTAERAVSVTARRESEVFLVDLGAAADTVAQESDQDA